MYKFRIFFLEKRPKFQFYEYELASPKKPDLLFCFFPKSTFVNIYVKKTNNAFKK